MRILFEDKVLAATLSAVNASSNYPVANLQNAFLKRRFQSTAAADTVTALFGADESIDCVYYGFTNATGIVIQLKNAGGAVLKTITITTPEEIGAHHFAAVPAVRSIVVQITGAGAGVYLGGLAAGEEVVLPNPEAEWEEPKVDNSTVSSSPDGQYNQGYLRPLRSYSWNLPDTTREDANTLSDLYLALGAGRPVWADPFEENHDFIPPIYCVITEPLAPRKSGRRYSITLSIAEAR